MPEPSVFFGYVPSREEKTHHRPLENEGGSRDSRKGGARELSVAEWILLELVDDEGDVLAGQHREGLDGAGVARVPRGAR